ncbi:MAG: YeeE/YedE thiosulfate transporter family protein [Candidatus Caldatribacteriota bacterium]|nr:YeeE/YedE thiosulfate transporter family protein [Atribacterota bacterium]MDI9596800.1 YeeE/YedE thiosulfate transporter family protein [Atribacterota bacterium]
MEIFTLKTWSPYLVGAGIGILSWFTFLLSNKPIGCSTAFARTSGMIEQALTGKSVEKKPYYQKFPAVIDWEWMFVLGIIIGSLVSAMLSGDFSLRLVPSLWMARFGVSFLPRFFTALIGGIVLGIGARWAGGCTSGHGISGTMQLALSSWIAVILFFISGVITAHIIYYGIGG